MFNISVFSRMKIEEVNTNKQFSLISIIEPLDKRVPTDDWQISHMSFPSMAANKPNCVSSLCLRFYDTDKELECDNNLIITPITNNQAKLIANFIMCSGNDIEELYVNCAAGISRSAGVAAAISKFYTDNDDRFYKAYVPNRYVYMKVLEALHEFA